jgi:hypothetical protein
MNPSDSHGPVQPPAMPPRYPGPQASSHDVGTLHGITFSHTSADSNSRVQSGIKQHLQVQPNHSLAQWCRLHWAAQLSNENLSGPATCTVCRLPDNMLCSLCIYLPYTVLSCRPKPPVTLCNQPGDTTHNGWSRPGWRGTLGVYAFPSSCVLGWVCAYGKHGRHGNDKPPVVARGG